MHKDAKTCLGRIERRICQPLRLTRSGHVDTKRGSNSHQIRKTNGTATDLLRPLSSRHIGYSTCLLKKGLPNQSPDSETFATFIPSDRNSCLGQLMHLNRNERARLKKKLLHRFWTLVGFCVVCGAGRGLGGADSTRHNRDCRSK